MPTGHYAAITKREQRLVIVMLCKALVPIYTENSWRWKEDCGDGNVRENQLMQDSAGQEPLKIQALYVLRRVDR